MRLGNEPNSVQQPLIEYAIQIGWNPVSREKSLEIRGGKTSFLFKDIFLYQIHKLNSGFMTQEIANSLFSRIERLKPNIEGNLEAWEYLKGLKTVFVPEEEREKDVRLIDSEDFSQNVYHVTDEFSFTNGSKTIRQDVVFLINGIPVFFIETKSAKKKEGIEEALDQIKRYHTECPELLAINQVYALTHILKYYYSSTWNTSVKYLFNWKGSVI